MKIISMACIFSIILTFTGCGDEKVKNSPVIETIEEINRVNDKQAQEKPDSTLAIDISNIQSRGRISNVNYGELFCEMIKEQTINNPFEIEKYFSELSQKRYEESIFNLLKSVECDGYETIFNKNPMQIVKLNISSKYNYYIAISLDKDDKIISLRNYWGENFEINYHEVEMTDGKKLTTFFIGKTDAAITSLWRTPYINSSPDRIFSHIDMVKNYNMNMIIQANRGSFFSEGHFRWLHKENIKDGYDTIDWITKQSFNNGQVVPMGGSYPGFNALAAAISKHPAILGTISCSSPTNAATDSLTNAKNPTPRYIDYVNEREQNSPTTNLYKKVLFLAKQESFDMRILDQELFGRRLQDWQEFVDSYQAKDHKYWDNRNILSLVKDIDKPTFHIAGMSQDQDSRDTILAVKYIQENEISPELHQTYLHGGGHGCGDFLESKQFKDLIAGNNPIDKPVYRYSAYTSNMVAKDIYSDTFKNWDIANYTLDNIKQESTTTIINNNKIRLFDDTQNNVMNAYLQTTEAGFINGVMKLELDVENYLYDTGILAFISIKNEYGIELYKSRMSYGQHFSQNDFAKKLKVLIPFELSYLYVPNKSWISIHIYSRTPTQFNYNQKEKEQFYKTNISDGKGYIDIDLSNPIKLHIPLETDTMISQTIIVPEPLQNVETAEEEVVIGP